MCWCVSRIGAAVHVCASLTPQNPQLEPAAAKSSKRRALVASAADAVEQSPTAPAQPQAATTGASGGGGGGKHDVAQLVFGVAPPVLVPAADRTVMLPTRGVAVDARQLGSLVTQRVRRSCRPSAFVAPLHGDDAVDDEIDATGNATGVAGLGALAGAGMTGANAVGARRSAPRVGLFALRDLSANDEVTIAFDSPWPELPYTPVLTRCALECAAVRRRQADREHDDDESRDDDAVNDDDDDADASVDDEPHDACTLAQLRAAAASSASVDAFLTR
jgi:hypothetical protein